MANKKYKLTDGNYWATDGVYDFDQGKTQREVNGDLIGAINNKIVRVTGTISSSSLVISNANVTASMVPISCEFGTPTNVSSASYTITTGSGTITFSGITLIASTTVDVILGVPKT